MKSFYRVIIAVLSVVLALGVCSLFVACDDNTTSKDTFTITVSECDETQGTVSIYPQKDKYESGEEVTITLVAKEGFAVKEFIRNNNDLTSQLKNKAYKAAIYNNWDIKVVWQTYDASLRWTVTTNEPEGGKVTIGSESEDGEYKNYETLEITVEVDEGYEIDDLTINGVSYINDLYNDKHVYVGTFSLEITEDWDIEATFKEFDYSRIDYLTVDSYWNKVINTKGIVLVDVWAPWCSPCKKFAPIYKEYAKLGNEVKLFKFDAADAGDGRRIESMTGRHFDTAKELYEAAGLEEDFHMADDYHYEDNPLGFASEELGVVKIPTLIMYKDGKKVGTMNANENTTLDILESFISSHNR